MNSFFRIPSLGRAALAAALAVVFAYYPSTAQAAEPAYLELEGERQGRIAGDVTLPGREGTIEVYGFTHNVVSPRDAASGLPTGKRQHKPISIIKAVDKATPLLANAWSNNEILTDFTLRFWRRSRSGALTQHYTIQLLNASIVSIRPWMPNTHDRDTAEIPISEEVAFTYQRIIWTWEDGGITAEDNWETTAISPPPAEE